MIKVVSSDANGGMHKVRLLKGKVQGGRPVISCPMSDPNEQ